MSMPPKITVEIWSDVMCPFCYLGDAVFQEALESFVHRESVTVIYRSFQLDPELTAEPKSMAEHLGGRYSEDQWAAMHEGLAQRGQHYGLTFNFDRSLIVNTNRAHQLSHFAAAAGKGAEAVRELFAAHFTDGANVADVEVLADIAERLGLDPAAARQALAEETYRQAVDADISLARKLGISGVPFFIFDNTYAVSGAQPTQMFQQALGLAWQKAAAEPATAEAGSTES